MLFMFTYTFYAFFYYFLFENLCFYYFLFFLMKYQFRKQNINQLELVTRNFPIHCTKNHIYFFQMFWKDDLFKKIREMKENTYKILGNMIFSVYMYKCYKHDITLLQKKSKTIFSRKNTLKGDLDRILEKVLTILCTFMETFIGVFIYCFPVKKNQAT